MGEKFAAHPVTGTGSTTVPIATSDGRAGVDPQLSLTYDSGSGNGAFGFGWSVALPAITRRTDNGLPRYLDDEDSDVFILSEQEDLVPAFKRAAGGALLRGPSGDPLMDEEIIEGHLVRRYRPRTEGLFARIERWTRGDGDVHWRVIDEANTMTIFGADRSSRIADPDEPTRIFSWLICETRDDRGNAIAYSYKAEDGSGVDLAQAHERNRGARADQRRTAHRYPKRIRYGNRVSLLNSTGLRPHHVPGAALEAAGWMFELVFDYGEHDAAAPHPSDDPARSNSRAWPVRLDPFSSHRSGFELRRQRLCHRILSFHHFPDEPAVGSGCLVRSTDLTYANDSDDTGADAPGHPIISVLAAVTHSGYTRTGAASYSKRSMPSLEFGYSRAELDEQVRELDDDSLANLPIGVDGDVYRWIDLDGEGASGILSRQAEAWRYKPSLGDGGFGALETIAREPSTASGRRHQQLLDLQGNGQRELASFDGATPGFFERTDARDWAAFRCFDQLPRIDWSDPNLRFMDLSGDGRADVLIMQDEAMTWYPSLAREGFGSARRVVWPRDEEGGPRLVFEDGEQSVFIADMCGDGLSDLVRVRSGEVCYWPNLGYGHFGGRVEMDDAPQLDHADRFDRRRVRLADVDGSGTSDLLYLGRDGVQIHFNQSGNRWSAPRVLRGCPPNHDMSRVTTADLLGNGTACLVWSSPLAHDAGHQLRYVDLMGGGKPHLLIRAGNNRGAETHVRFAPSTKFFQEDKRQGRPWITKLPFPVHVVERIETYDHVNRNRYASRYAYHDGYFDGDEREFGGFGMVEQWDTDELASLSAGGRLSTGDGMEAASHVPPVHTKTWFHTGAPPGRDRVPNHLGRPEDCVLPEGLTVDEEREASRALRGSVLRSEVRAVDGSDRAQHPYTITEQNLTVQCLQNRGANAHGVFLAHARESVASHYERDPTDPRTVHELTLEVNHWGQVLKTATIAYGRRHPDPGLPLQVDREKQTQTLATSTERDFTEPVSDALAHRAPLVCETRNFELTGYAAAMPGGRVAFSDLVRRDPDGVEMIAVSDGELSVHETPSTGKRERRLIERLRIRYRRDDLAGLLPFGELESMALPGDTHMLAFTAQLAHRLFVESGRLPANGLSDVLTGAGGYVQLGGADWWAPSGASFFHVDVDPGDQAGTAAQELAEARAHFFLPRKLTDPFGHGSTLEYDTHDLQVVLIRDAAGNTTTARHDYRVLQPARITDPNGNASLVCFDALGRVTGTAVQGKSAAVGDRLDGFAPDLEQAQIDAFAEAADPTVLAPELLGAATTRVIYDHDRFRRTRDADPLDPATWRPCCAATLIRETHAGADLPPHGLRIGVSFSYSDGFDREVQSKIQAEPGPLALGGPVAPRWVGSGWTVFNNKGKPVRKYEPFFSRLTQRPHRFEFGAAAGFSPIAFYDPMGRVIAMLHPDHTYEKVVFDSWSQTTYDANDTVAATGAETGDPRSDPRLAGVMAGYFATQPSNWSTWHQQRFTGAMGVLEQSAAQKASAHADTPSVVHLDPLGRGYLTQVHHGFEADDTPIKLATRVELDIGGNELELRDSVEQDGDARGRIAMRYGYDMLGRRVHEASLDTGERWTLSDVSGEEVRRWDSRGHASRAEFDALRRPIRRYVRGADLERPESETLTERLIYGEQHPEATQRNLRGRLHRHLDQAGALTSEAHDFKGNRLRASRRLAREYRRAIDWTPVDAAVPASPSTAFAPALVESVIAPLLEPDTFTSRTAYDALNRPVQVVAPHTGHFDATRSIIQPTYNVANLLDRVDVWLDHPTGPIALLDPAKSPPSAVGIRNIDYDAKGRRTLIEYKNGAVTLYDHDPETLRLRRVYTRRGPAFTADCQNPHPPPALIAAPSLPPDATPCGLQNLNYTYDPVGNPTHIRDAAQPTIFFRNTRVEPSSDFTYDPAYRLIEATGREHLGQVGGAPPPHSHGDQFRVGLAWSANDGNAMGAYVERYEYDRAGNLVAMRHRGSAAQAGWARTFTHDEPSLLEPLKRGNRVSRAPLAGDPSTSIAVFGYDAHGNATRMPHLPLMRSDHRDQLQSTVRQTTVSGVPEATWYVYGADGQRVRKVTDRALGAADVAAGGTPARRSERIYLDGFEIFREYGPLERLDLERETLHVMTDQGRTAVVETRTWPMTPDPSDPRRLTRYQIANHLGSSTVELDDQARIISYEEYTPYGSTAYQAVRSQTEASKRYRYSGKERDEESGLYYHGARYYAPWLGSWASGDPAGAIDGPNLYRFVGNAPTTRTDPTGRAGYRVDDLYRPAGSIWIGLPEVEGTPMPERMELDGRPRGRSMTRVDPIVRPPVPPPEPKPEPKPKPKPKPPPPPPPPPKPAPTPTPTPTPTDPVPKPIGPDELPYQLHEVNKEIRQLREDMKKTEQEGKSGMIAAVPGVGWFVAAAYDLYAGNIGGGLQNVAEEAVQHTAEEVAEKVGEKVGKKVLPPGWSGPLDVYQMGKGLEAHAANVKRMDELLLRRYELMEALGDPEARYDINGRWYKGPKGVLYDKRTGAPAKRF